MSNLDVDEYGCNCVACRLVFNIAAAFVCPLKHLYLCYVYFMFYVLYLYYCTPKLQSCQ